MGVDTQMQYMTYLEELSHKPTQSDEDLSNFLNRYRACLNPMDFDDAVQCVLSVDFSVAGQLVVGSVNVYGKKVDKLGETTENLLHDIISSNTKRNGEAGDAQELDPAPEPINRRRQRRIRDSLHEEDFHDIENPIKTVQNLQQTDTEKSVTILECKLSHCAQIDSNKRRLDVRLKKKDDKDKSRLRDWFLNEDLMVVRETFTEESMTDESRFPSINASFADPTVEPRLIVLENANDVPVETETIIGAMSPMRCGDDVAELSDACSSEDEYQVPCHREFRELIEEKKEHIIEIKLKPGKTTRPPCPKCNSRRPHAVCGRLCKQYENPAFLPMEAYFQKFVDKTIKRPLLGPIQDKELTEPYLAHLNMLKQLKKQNDVDFANARGDASFRGFDDEDLDDDFARCNNSVLGTDEDIPHMDDADFDLPQANSAFPSLRDDVVFAQPEGDLPKEESQGVDNMERAKEMVVRITQWHESLRSKIAMSEERGTLDMDLLACRIMEDFPKDKKKISFRELVQNEPSTNVARYFLTCLQLANEGNLLIEPADRENSMFLEKLRDTRLKILDEYNSDQQPITPKKRKNNSTDTRKRRHH